MALKENEDDGYIEDFVELRDQKMVQLDIDIEYDELVKASKKVFVDYLKKELNQ